MNFLTSKQVNNLTLTSKRVNYLIYIYKRVNYLTLTSKRVYYLVLSVGEYGISPGARKPPPLRKGCLLFY